MLCWAAIDRAIRLARKRSFPAPLARWHEERDAIYQDIFTHFWDASRKAFVQSKGSSAVDASSLLMPLVKFIAPADPRWVSTLRAAGGARSSAPSLTHDTWTLPFFCRGFCRNVGMPRHVPVELPSIKW